MLKVRYITYIIRRLVFVCRVLDTITYNGDDGYPDFSVRMTTREFVDRVVANRIAMNIPVSPTLLCSLASRSQGRLSLEDRC